MVDLQPHGKQYRGGATELCGPAGKALMPSVAGAVPKNVEEHSCCILLEGVGAAGTNARSMGGGKGELTPWWGGGADRYGGL